MRSRYKENMKASNINRANEEHDIFTKKFFNTANKKRLNQIANDGIFNNADMVFNMSYKSYENLLTFVINYFCVFIEPSCSGILTNTDLSITEMTDIMEKKNAIIHVSDEETIRKCGHSFEISSCFDLSKYYKDDKDDEFNPSSIVATNANLTSIEFTKSVANFSIRYTGETTVGAHKYKASIYDETYQTPLILVAHAIIKINNKSMVLANNCPNREIENRETDMTKKNLIFTSYNAILSQVLQTVYKHISPNDRSKIFNTKILNGVSYIDVTADNDEFPVLFIDYLIWYFYGKLNQNDRKYIPHALKPIKRLMNADVSKALSEIDDIMKIDDSSIDKFIDLWKGNDYATPPYETFDIPMQGLILEYNNMVIKFSTNIPFEKIPNAFDVFGVMEIQYPSIDFSTRLPIFINKETMNLEFYRHIIDEGFCKRILKAWYGIQVALRHPAIRTIVERDCVINDTTEIDISMPKEKRHVTTYYNMTGERIEYVLSGGSGKHFKRHTMSWYVIGHWRKIGEDKKTFVKGHWRGPLRDMLSTEPHRERELKEVKV